MCRQTCSAHCIAVQQDGPQLSQPVWSGDTVVVGERDNLSVRVLHRKVPGGRKIKGFPHETLAPHARWRSVASIRFREDKQ
jgi:hypothetical protein